MNIKNQLQQAFSLIELMIVIVIIAILAAIAVPAYNDYIVRAKTSNMIAAVGSIKQAFSEYRQTVGNYANVGATTAEILTSIGATDPAPLSEVVAGVELAVAITDGSTTKDTAAILICGNTSELGFTSGNHLGLIYVGEYDAENGGMIWECYNNGFTPASVIPSNCRKVYGANSLPANEPDISGALDCSLANGVSSSS